MKRTLTDLLPPAGNLLERLRRVLVTGGLTAFGVVSAQPLAAHSASVPSPSQEHSLSATIVDRSRKAAKLVLSIPGKTANFVIAHRSHRSHSSHRSHASHYSGSTGTSRPAPTVKTPPPAAVAALEPEIAKLSYFDATIESINRTERSVVLKSEAQKYTVYYRDDTKYALPGMPGQRLDEYFEKNHNTLPFSVGQKVRIRWKLNTDSTKSIAVLITPAS